MPSINASPCKSPILYNPILEFLDVVDVRSSLPLPLLVLRIQRADDVHAARPLLSSFPPDALLNVNFRPFRLFPILHPAHSRLPMCHPKSSHYMAQHRSKIEHTLQPSHIFLTELRTFIPRTCSNTPAFIPVANPSFSKLFKTGLRAAAAKEKHLALVVGLTVRREGNSTRAVRRKVVVGIIFVD